MIENCPIGHAVIKGQTWCCPWCRALKAEAAVAALLERAEKAEAAYTQTVTDLGERILVLEEQADKELGQLLDKAEAENKDLREVNTFLSAAEDMHLANADTLRARALKAEAEVERLRGMVTYARGAPDLVSVVSILTDALDGVTGADNVQEVRGELEILRTENAWLREEIEKAPHARKCTMFTVRHTLGRQDERPCDCWKAEALAGPKGEDRG